MLDLWGSDVASALWHFSPFVKPSGFSQWQDSLLLSHKALRCVCHHDILVSYILDLTQLTSHAMFWGPFRRNKRISGEGKQAVILASSTSWKDTNDLFPLPWSGAPQRVPAWEKMGLHFAPHMRETHTI